MSSRAVPGLGSGTSTEIRQTLFKPLQSTRSRERYIHSDDPVDTHQCSQKGPSVSQALLEAHCSAYLFILARPLEISLASFCR